jgi:outer membrane protein assembly factor BamB
MMCVDYLGHRALRLLLVACVATTLSAQLSAESSWPAFLGAGATGVRPESLPSAWSPEQNTLWTAAIPGHGQSSPVIWEQRVFVTSVEGPMKDTCRVLCFSAVDGEEIWRGELKNSVPQENSLYVSRAAPTPVVDSDRLVTLFESGDCVAWSLDGEILWQRNLSADYGPINAKFGLGASPCQTQDLVFVLLEQEGPSCLLALSKSSGETVWKAQRSPRQSWSSPAIIQVAGQPQVVVSSLGSVDGYQADTGQLLWSLNDVGGNTGATPIDAGEGRFLIGASPGRQGEHAEAAKVSNGMIQIAEQGDGYSAGRLWVAADASPTWASPIVHQGLAYWINRVGVVTCYDAETGQLVYQKRTKQSCWATPLAISDRIYWFGKDGLCTVIAAGREFKVLSESPLWTEGSLLPDELPKPPESSPQRQAAAVSFSGPIVYGYAVAGDRIVARIGNQLFCIGNR